MTKTAAQKDPNRKKKELTPFFVFMKKRRFELRDDPVMKSVTEFTKSIATEWNLLTTQEKLKYKPDGEYGKKVMAEISTAPAPSIK